MSIDQRLDHFTRTAPRVCWRRGSHFCGGGLLVAICLGLIGAGCEPTPFSRPTAALRNTNDYATAVQGTSPTALSTMVFDSISVSYQSNLLVVTGAQPGAIVANDGFAHANDRLEAGESLRGVNGTLELVAIGAGFDGGGKNTRDAHGYLPLDFFSPAGKRLAEEDLKALGLRSWDRSVSMSQKEFPKVRFLLGSTKHPPGYYSVKGLFDARTKRSLTHGYGYSQVTTNSLGHIDVDYRAWHGTPLELVLDVELDGSSVVETNLIGGSIIAVPGGLVKVLGLWEGSSTSWSTSGSRTELGLDGEGSELLYACEPGGLAVHVDCLDAAGKSISTGGATGFQSVKSISLEKPASDAKWLRLMVFTNHHEVVLRLPPLPILPAENQHVDNLFAVRVPLVQIESENQLRDFIGEVTQMSFLYPQYPQSGNAMPTNCFPFLRTNTTPALLMTEYVSHLPRGYHLKVDEKSHQIRVEQTLVTRARLWLKQLLE